MEYQTLTKSLVVVVMVSVIWTLTANGEKMNSCCTSVSTSNFSYPILGFKIQNESLPCVRAIIFETKKKRYFCSDPGQPWVKTKVLQFLKARGNKHLTSTPAPSSSVSAQTQEGRLTHAPDMHETSTST